MSLARRLKREATANPAKAGGLGVLLLVAGWFWAPLVKGFFVSEDTGPVPSAPTASASATPSPSTAAPAPTVMVVGVPKAAVDTTYDWQRYAQLMDSDPKMQSALELPSARDPFKAVLPPEPEPVVVQTSAKQEQAAPSATLSPKEAGLVLSSTFVGPRKQTALIGGKPYRVGDRVRAEKDGQRLSYKLVDVQPRRIILERNGNRYELSIARAGKNATQAIEPDDEERDEEEEEEGMDQDSGVAEAGDAALAPPQTTQ
jgi:hypothetical protein